jgi:hypothetical protein
MHQSHFPLIRFTPWPLTQILPHRTFPCIQMHQSIRLWFQWLFQCLHWPTQTILINKPVSPTHYTITHPILFFQLNRTFWISPNHPLKQWHTKPFFNWIMNLHSWFQLHMISSHNQSISQNRSQISRYFQTLSSLIYYSCIKQSIPHSLPQSRHQSFINHRNKSSQYHLFLSQNLCYHRILHLHHLLSNSINTLISFIT